jgi:hypothetical protein
MLYAEEEEEEEEEEEAEWPGSLWREVDVFLFSSAEWLRK